MGVDIESLADWALEVLDAVLDRFIDPKPLKSGTSPPSGADGFSGSIVELRADACLESAKEGGGVVVIGGELSRLALVVAVRDSGRREEGVCCFSGEIDRARSSSQ